MQLSVRSTIIQGMRFFCAEYAVVGLPVIGLSDGLQSSNGCVFSCIEYAVVSFPVVDLLNGLQSSKGCVSSALSMQLSLYQLLGYRTV